MVAAHGKGMPLLLQPAQRSKCILGQDVELPPMSGRYDDQLLDLASTIRGEKENEFPYAHDLAVHEAILRASGLPTD